MLEEPWEDDLIAASGSAVQMTILSHNCGYDNSRFEEKKVNRINILPAYQKHLKDKKLEEDPTFYGANITCLGNEYHDIMQSNSKCGGVIANQSQHYAYSIVAQHILAACYYGLNYSSTPAFKDYAKYTRSGGYCVKLGIPSADDVRKGGKK